MNPALVLWQACSDDMVPEQALAFKRFSGMIEIQQEERSVLINLESIPEVCRILRKMQKEEE